MNCFECAKTNDSVPAVGLCRHCGVGLCLEHLVEARGFRVGGTCFGCAHALPGTKPMRGMPAGIAAATRHHSASVT